jgi:anti-sigma-K factor RskA
MNYLQPERLDRLAREYVLGTLTGRARRRFERVVQYAPVAARAVGAWQERLAALAAGVPPMQPREQVWQGLERRLFHGVTSAAGAVAPGPLRRLSAWLSGRALVGAVAGMLVAVVVLRLQPQLAGLEARSQELPASYVGLLLDSGGRPTLLASSRRHGRELTVKVLQPVAVPPGRIVQLWALRADGSLFPVAAWPVLPAKGSLTVNLPDTSERLFFDVPRLAVSFEAAPKLAGQRPSGEPPLSGFCVKLW